MIDIGWSFEGQKLKGLATESSVLEQHPLTTGKIGVVVQPFFAVSCCTAAASSTHVNDKMHDNVSERHTTKKTFTAKSAVAHDKDTAHDKDQQKRTAKKLRRQRP
jgi:hypothetical protein